MWVQLGAILGSVLDHLAAVLLVEEEQAPEIHPAIVFIWELDVHADDEVVIYTKEL